MSNIRVNIFDKAYIPTLGRGPFKDRLINVELYRSLKRLGYLIEEVVEPAVAKIVLEEESAPAVEETPVVEEPVQEETPVVEEPVQEETPVVEEPVQEEEVTETEEELFTEEEIKFLTGKAKRAEIVELFEQKGIEVTNTDATIGELLALVGLARK